MSGIKPQQILIPRQVYIGDTAELRCSFNSGNEQLKELASLDSSIFIREIDTNDIEIKTVSLTPAGVDFYQLSISFVPWKTGSLELPPVQIEDTVLEFEPIQIVSLVETQKLSALKESAPPLLLPGTSYRIYAAIIILVLLMLAIIRLIIKRRSLSFFVKNLILELKCRKNRRLAEKKLLSQLSDSSLTDKNWAEGTQEILRKYLSVKFQIDFFRLTTPEIMPAFMEITGGILEKKNEAMGRITEIFVRTDFIRYSSEGALLDNEKKEITDELLRLISQIEAQEAKND